MLSFAADFIPFDNAEWLSTTAQYFRKRWMPQSGYLPLNSMYTTSYCVTFGDLLRPSEP